jgi:hypothetical protein
MRTWYLPVSPGGIVYARVPAAGPWSQLVGLTVLTCMFGRTPLRRASFRKMAWRAVSKWAGAATSVDPGTEADRYDCGSKPGIAR